LVLLMLRRSLCDSPQAACGSRPNDMAGDLLL
jgi:hypothetical protein